MIGKLYITATILPENETQKVTLIAAIVTSFVKCKYKKMA